MTTFSKALPQAPQCSTKGLVNPWKIDLNKVSDGDIVTIKGWHAALTDWLNRNEAKNFQPYRFETVRFCWAKAQADSFTGEVKPLLIKDENQYP